MSQSVNIPGCKFPTEDAAAKKRRELRERLLNGQTISLAKDGNVIDENKGSSINAPTGVLAAQWYEANPTLLTMEKIAMARSFSQFTLDRLDDGRLCWVGVLEPGVYESKYGEKRQYHVMAVYDNNHPNQKMGSSVKVYPLMPDIQEIIKSCGFTPLHLLSDEVGNVYLCTNEAGDQKVGATVTTAASVLAWASKWFIAFELVLTGDLSLAVFNSHGGI